ncbi:MAG: metallopeptidase family protein [Chloroflexi bacterium]|nr:metallopeptidase family protein [Chloroflexota bacterium]
MTPAEFEEHVREAIAGIPEGLRDHLENVEVLIADWPTEDELESAEVPPGYTLFGLYSGVPLTERTSGYHMVLPDRITIFQGPLEEAYRDPDALREEIRSTVIHEFAHHFGLSDDDLRRWGVA